MVVDAAPPFDYSPVGVFTLAANAASAAAATADRRQSNFLSWTDVHTTVTVACTLSHFYPPSQRPSLRPRE